MKLNILLLYYFTCDKLTGGQEKKLETNKLIIFIINQVIKF